MVSKKDTRPKEAVLERARVIALTPMSRAVP